MGKPIDRERSLKVRIFYNLDYNINNIFYPLNYAFSLGKVNILIEIFYILKGYKSSPH